nr:hypothetical protein CFP56_09038 [Quercus suber]
MPDSATVETERQEGDVHVKTDREVGEPWKRRTGGPIANITNISRNLYAPGPEKYEDRQENMARHNLRPSVPPFARRNPYPDNAVPSGPGNHLQQKLRTQWRRSLSLPLRGKASCRKSLRSVPSLSKSSISSLPSHSNLNPQPAFPPPSVTNP